MRPCTAVKDRDSGGSRNDSSGNKTVASTGSGGISVSLKLVSKVRRCRQKSSLLLSLSLLLLLLFSLFCCCCCSFRAVGHYSVAGVAVSLAAAAAVGFITAVVAAPPVLSNGRE